MMTLSEMLRDVRFTVKAVKDVAAADGMDEVAVNKLVAALRLLEDATNRLGARENDLVGAR